ncbi:MAG: DUF3379 family protein, partial [Ketobacter sp.]
HCAACYRYSKVLLKQNEMLKQALEVPVPEGLSDKIIFNQHLEKSYKLKKWVAAACVALLFFSYISLVPKTKNHDWALISAQHVAAEEETLALNNSLVENDLKTALLEWGLTLKSSLGAITYLDYCSMPNGKGLHIVFKRNDSQRFSVIISPKNTSSVESNAIYGDYHSSSVISGKQLISVVTNHPNQLEGYKSLISENIISVN